MEREGDGMKEYIVPIYDDGRDDDSIFVGEIREKATEVVRCKDCKFFCEQFSMNCVYHVSAVCENWFCSQGRVKE